MGMRGRHGRGFRGIASVVVGVAVLASTPIAAGVVGADPAPRPQPQPPATTPDSPPDIAAQDESAVVVRGGPRSTAALYDEAGQPVWEGPLPFASPIAYPQVTALDDGSYAVAGIPCASATPDDPAGLTCAPGGVAVARFDPHTQAFTPAPAPLPGLEGTTAYVEVLGAHGTDLVVQVGAGLHVVPGDGGAPVALPPSPFERTTLACVQGDQVVVVEQKLGPGDASPAPGEMVEASAAPYTPFEAAVLDLTTHTWTLLGGPDAAYGSNDTFEIGCLEQGVLAAPTERPLTTGAPYASFVLDVDAGRWHEAAAPPREFLAAAPAATASQGSELALSVSGDLANRDVAVLVYDAAGGTWAETRGGGGADAGPLALSDDRLWATSPSAQPTVADLRHDEIPTTAEPVEPPPLPTPTAAAAALDIAVFEWNICGNACYGNRIDPADKVAYMVIGSNPRPWTVALNEVCHSSNQHYRIVNALDDVGYHGEVYVARNNFVACGNRSYGNSIFSVGGEISVSRYSYKDQDGSAEVRGFVCAKNTGFLGDWNACSTHMDSDPNWSSKQTRELRAITGFGGNMLQIIGGDFNLPPDHTAIQEWRFLWDEIDEAQPWGNTTDTHGKLDYIWIRDAGSMSSPYAPVFFNDTGNPSSDHHAYSGRFRFG